MLESYCMVPIEVHLLDNYSLSLWFGGTGLRSRAFALHKRSSTFLAQGGKPGRTGVAQLVKFLLCKHENMSSTPRTNRKKLGVLACAYKVNARRPSQEGPWGPQSSHLTETVSPKAVRDLTH